MHLSCGAAPDAGAKQLGVGREGVVVVALLHFLSFSFSLSLSLSTTFEKQSKETNAGSVAISLDQYSLGGQRKSVGRSVEMSVLERTRPERIHLIQLL